MTVEIIIIICLVVAGVALMLAEIFLLPGITIAGIAGGVMMVGSIAYAFYFVGETTGYITIAANVIVGIGAFIVVIKSNALDHIALKTDIEAIVEQPEIKSLSVGEKGIALSRLNPIGKVEFVNDAIVEAKSVTGEFIDAGENVEIVHIEKAVVLVKASTI